MLTILDEKNKGYALGASDYMTKPIDRGRLRTLLAKYRSDRGQRVLIVEDDEATRHLLQRMLTGAPCVEVGGRIDGRALGRVAVPGEREEPPPHHGLQTTFDPEVVAG